MGTPTVTTSLAVSRNEFFALAAVAYRHHRLLVASTAETFSVPADANYVLFSSTDDFYVAYTSGGEGTVTAVVPSSDVTDGSGMDLNPTQRMLHDVDEISIISEAAAKVTMTFFRE